MIGLGTELVDVARVREALAKDGAGSLDGVYTDGEQATCLRRADPAPGLAARLAAKRATLHALGSPAGATPLEVEVLHLSSGKPELALSGAALARSAELAVSGLHVTLTHVDMHALAVVLLEGGS